MNRVANCIQLLQILADGQIYKKDYLAKLLNTLPRNLHSYRLDLYDAGYDIESISGRYGGYRLANKHILPAFSFGESDFELFQLLIDFLIQSHFTYKHETILLLSKLNQSQSSFKSNISYFRTFEQQEDLLSKSKLEILNHAIMKRQIIEFDYVRSDFLHSYRKVKPYAVINYDSFWYLIAVDCNDEKTKYFKVSKRMNQLKFSTKTFLYDNSFNVNHYIKSEFFFKFETQDVICKVKGTDALLLEEQPKGKVKQMYWIDDQLYYHATFDSLKQATSFIMSINTNANLIGPEPFKKIILNRIREMLVSF